MNNQRWILLFLCFTLVGNVGASQSVQANQAPQKKQQRYAPQEQGKKSKSIIDWVWKIIKPVKDKKLGSRSGICPIMPGLLEDQNQILSPQPLFTWRGQAQEIQVFNDDTDELIWQQSLSEQQRSIAYSGPMLQPNQYYRWLLTNGASPIEQTFMVLSAQGQTPVASEQQDIFLVNESIDLSPDLQKAVYEYRAQQRWSDMLATLYRIEDPSGELTMVLDDLSRDMCNMAWDKEETNAETVAMP